MLYLNSSATIALGIIIGLLASLVQSLGLTLQRKSHVINQRAPEEEQRAEHRRPLWLLGVTLFVGSNILGSIVQIASLPVVILAPLGAVSLLWNAFFARILLGDVFSPWMILGTLFIAGGAVIIAIFGIVPDPTRSLDDLLELFARPTFIAYFSILGMVIIACLAATHIAEFSLKRRLRKEAGPSVSHTPDRPSTLTMASDPNVLTTGVTEIVSEATATERTPLLDPKPPPSSRSASPSIAASPSAEKTRILLAISYASISGTLSGMCLLFAKSGIELLLLTIRGDNQFWRWQAWMLLLGLVGFALLQLWYMHKGLVLADPTLVCPSAFCFYNLSSIVNGLVYFNQMSLMTPLNLGLVGLGIVVLLAGVWIVSIQAGGGGVDVVSFDEDSDGELSGEATPLIAGRDLEEHATHPADDRDWAVESDPNIASHSMSNVASPPRSPSNSPPDSRHHKRRSNTDSYGDIHLSPTRHPRHTRTGSRNFSPPTPINTLSGFQIGLSPLSPGFSLVRKDKRRRSSQFDGTADENQRRRRTVSEGTLNETELLLSPTNESRGLEEGYFEGPSIDSLELGGHTASESDRSRWGWVRRLVGGKRR